MEWGGVLGGLGRDWERGICFSLFMVALHTCFPPLELGGGNEVTATATATVWGWGEVEANPQLPGVRPTKSDIERLFF